MMSLGGEYASIKYYMFISLDSEELQGKSV